MTDVGGVPRVGAPRGPVVLGPIDVGGRAVILRPARFDDHPRWQEVRLRDRALIEPFWARSTQTWEERHSRNEWVREVLAARRTAVSGRALPCVIEVDGTLAGQCALTAIDTVTGTAELGVWIESRLGRAGIVTVAVGMIVDHAFRNLGVDRVVAPTAADNVPAARASARAGFHREATLPGWAPTGGHDVVAHDLWVIDRDDLGPGGMTTSALRLVDPTAGEVDITRRTRPAPVRTILPRRADDAVAMFRFDIGRLRAGIRKMTPPPVPLRLDVAETGLRLRRRSALAVSMRPLCSPDFDDLCTPIRPGAWFDTDDADVVYDVLDARGAIGRISLVGVNRSQGFAELAVSMDRGAASASDRAVGGAVREMLCRAVPAMSLRRISTAVAPTDVRAARLAGAAGLRRETSLEGSACGRPAGRVEVWALSATTGDARA